MATLRIMSLNVERLKHARETLSFISSYNPDVLCVQELPKHRIEELRSAYPFQYDFAEMGCHPADHAGEAAQTVGAATLSRFPMRSEFVYYYGSRQRALAQSKPERLLQNLVLIRSTVMKCGEFFPVLNTHFLWSDKGEATDAQRVAMRNLLYALGLSGEFVLCGDLNAPRGGEIFTMLLEGGYVDAIPHCYKTSVDLNLHRHAKMRREELADKMVDVLITHGKYRARDVRLQFGVSDHAAILAQIERTCW